MTIKRTVSCDICKRDEDILKKSNLSLHGFRVTLNHEIIAKGWYETETHICSNCLKQFLNFPNWV
jgi:hypothetical protein